MSENAPTYIFDASSKPSLPVFDLPLIEATDQSLKGYGHLVEDPDACKVEIVRWPAQGWRPVDISEADKDPSKADFFFGNIDKDRELLRLARRNHALRS